MNDGTTERDAELAKVLGYMAPRTAVSIEEMADLVEVGDHEMEGLLEALVKDGRVIKVEEGIYELF